MKLTGRTLPAVRLADDGARPTIAAKRRSSEGAWWALLGALCSSCTESLGSLAHNYARRSDSNAPIEPLGHDLATGTCRDQAPSLGG
jgi:hypothetical protein